MEWYFVIIFVILAFLVGFFVGRLQKFDGRLVIDESHDEYFIAITTKPEELKSKKLVHFKVITKRGDGK